ncbi:lipopolysaccharide biosynthesis protein [Neptunomonas sp.]|uniref:lipopolysaccharide biosynthesis protein n=1 Tax=Neptunomonas sp. TaxID=1971898 RepID=UPI00356AF8CF
MSSRDRLFKSSIANSASLIVRIIQQLLLVTILVTVWPAQLYGEWLVVSAIPIFLSLADFGFVLAGSNELSRRATSENKKSVVDFYSTYSVYFQRWSLLIATLLAGFAFILPIKEWMSLEVMSATEVSTVFLLLSLSALISQNSLTLVAGLRSKGKTHYGLWIRVLLALLQTALAFILVWVFKASPVSLAAGMLLLTLGGYWFEWLVLKRLGLCQIRKLYQPLNNEISMKPYLFSGLEMMLIPLAQAIILQGSIILIAKALDPIAVVIFATHRTFARLGSSVVKVFANPLLSEAGLLQSYEDRPELTKIVTILSRVTFWLALLMVGGFILLGSWIYTLWTQGNISFDKDLLLILLAGVVAESLWQIVTVVRMGSNRHRPVAWGYLIFAVLGLIIAGLLVIDYGILGVALGVTLIDIAMMILAIWSLKGVVDITIREFVWGLAKPPIKEINQLLQKALKRGSNNAN